MFIKGLYFNQDDSSGNTATSADAQETTDDGAGDSGKANAQASASDKNTGEEKAKSHKAPTFSPEQQEWIEKQLIPSRLQRAKFDADQVADKARKKAEEESLAKNQEFEKLAAQRQTDIETLTKQLAEATPFKEQAERYKVAIENVIKAQTDKLPASIKELLAKLDPIEKMEYLAKHAKELNIEVKGVPETDTDDKTDKLSKAEIEKAQRNNAKLVKSLFSG